MADASYDVVIIGGGHNGLIAGGYLAMNGLSVAIFERQHELGGGACSDELPLPAFVSNPCAHSTRFHSHPAYRDFNLAEKGLDLVFPPVGQGAAWPDGKCIVTYPTWPVVDKMTGRTEFSQENMDKTFKSFATVSEQDAETGARILELFHTKWLAASHEVIYNPPPPWGEKDALEKLLDDPNSGLDPMYQFITTAQLARDWFESEHLQAYFVRRVSGALGTYGEDVPGLMAAVHCVGIMFSVFASSIPIGGTHAITHALQKHLSGLGGQFFVHHEVDKVLIENGTAKGIRLVDGTEIEAKKMVISNVDPDQTINRLIGKDYVSRRVSRRARNFKYDRACLYWANVACYELPKYICEAEQPDFAQCHGRTLLPADSDYMESKHKAELWVNGLPSQVALLIFEDTRHVPQKAAPGTHNLMVENYAPPARFFSEKQWLKLKDEFRDLAIEQWQLYAPNMTRDNFIGWYTNTPLDVERRNINMREGSWDCGAQIACQMTRFRPTPELSGYRMPINNMYYASASAHHGAGVRGTPGYNCYKVLQQDYGLRKIWEEMGRPY